MPANERGATLPLAILVIALLSLGLVAGLTRVSAERRISGNLETEVDAYAVATAGLSRYLASVRIAPPATFDTSFGGLPGGGSASISVRQLRAATGARPALYVIKARGVRTGSRFDARTPAGDRSVAQFAEWLPGAMSVMGAVTSLTGVRKNGAAGLMAGADQCGVVGAVAGVAAPAVAVDGNPGYNQTGGPLVPSGSPGIDYPAPSASGFDPLIKIDWDGIVNRGAIVPDYSLLGTTSWPTSFVTWPTILVQSAAVTLGAAESGRGLLIVTGDVLLENGFAWDGVILTGGALASNGAMVVQGAVVAGLNVKLGQTVGVATLASGNTTFVYNSCHVAAALQQLGSLSGVPNARVDNWATY